jgi:hypothetical protein
MTALDPYFARNIAAERRHLWERTRRMEPGRLANEFANSLAAAQPILDSPDLRPHARRSGTVVHYRMVSREITRRML